jgi:transposase
MSAAPKAKGEIVKALTGNYHAEHLFALKQAVALYDMYTTQVQDCDTELERLWQAQRPAREQDLPPLDTPDKRKYPQQKRARL